jgi:hypothetical protein
MAAGKTVESEQRGKYKCLDIEMRAAPKIKLLK